MELIENEDLSEVLKEFPFPSDPKKIISGPEDLTRAQAKVLGRKIKEATATDEGGDDDFLTLVFTYWATLPGARWNLAKKGKPIPLDAESLERELRKGDFSDLAFLVTQHLYPHFFKDTGPDSAVQEDDDDVTDGLVMEPGSQAASETIEWPSAPNG